MVVKQTQSELYANVRAFYEIIKPAVLWIIPTTSMTPDQTGHARDNGALFDLWMSKNARTGDEVDYSVENMRKCYKALRETGVLTFSVPPKSLDPQPVLSAQQKGLRNHAQPEDYKIPEGKNVIENERILKLAEASATILMQCVREIEGYRGKTHGKTASGRSVLKEILDKGTVGGSVTPAQASHLLDRIREKSKVLYDEQ